MSYELAKAYVQIVPTTKGIKGNIEAAISPEAESAGKKAGGVFTSGFGGALKGIGTVAGVAMAAGAAAMTGFIKSAVTTGESFDAAMSQVAATMGKSMDDMLSETATVELAWGKFSGNLRDYAKEIGANTAFSAQQAAEALNFMALAGYDTETAMNMLPNVLNLAAAGNMDLALASDMVTDTQSALGLSLEETSEMVDQMAKASSKSNTSVTQLGEAMLKIGATARDVKGGTAELSTMLGVLADNGIKGTEGGTHLRNILLSLQDACEDGTVFFEDIGISVYDADGNMRSMIDIVKDMQDELGRLSDESRATLLSGVFNKTDLASINALLGTSSDRFDELYGEIALASGAAQDMADTQLDNLAGDITLMKSAFEGLQIAISDGATPSIRGVVSGITEVINGFNDMVSGVEGGSERIQKGIEGMLEGVSEGFPIVLELASSVFSGVVEMIPGIVGEIIDLLPGLFDEVLSMLSSLIPGLARLLPDIISAALQMVTQLVSHLSEIILPVIRAIPQILKDFVKGLISNLPTLIDGILNLVVDIARELPSLCAEIVEYIPELFVSIGKAIVEAIPKILSAVVEVVKAIGRALLGLDDPVKDAKEQLTGLTESADTSWNHINETLNKPVSVDGLLSNLGHTTQDIDTEIDRIEGEITSVISTRLQEQADLRDKDIKDIEEYLAEIRRLEEEKLSIYSGQAEATVESMRRNTDASARELLQQYNDVVQYNDLARDAAETSKTNEYINAKNIYTAMTADLKNRLETEAGFTQANYDAEMLKAEEYYNSLLDEADAAYEGRLASLNETEAEALAIATGANQNYLKDLQNTYTEANNEVDEHLAAISDFAKKLDPIFGGATDEAAYAFKQMLGTLDKADIATTQSMLSMAAAIKSGGNDITGDLAETINVMLDTFDGMPAELQEDGGEFLASLCAGMEEYMPQLGDMSGKTADEILQSLRAELGLFGGGGGIFEVTNEAGENFTEGFSSGIESGTSDVETASTNVADAATDTLKAGLQENSPSRVTQEIGEFATEGFAKGILAKASLPKSSASTVVSQAIAGMQSGSFVSSAYWVGANMMDAVGRGINSKSAAIAAIAAAAVRAAINSAKAEAEISSPSRVMRDEVGLMLSEGMGLGIKDGEDYIIGAIEDISGSVWAASEDMALSSGNLPDDLAAMAATRQDLDTAMGYNALYRMRQMDGAASGDPAIYITNNIDGAENPEEFASRLVRQIKLEMRMA